MPHDYSATSAAYGPAMRRNEELYIATSVSELERLLLAGAAPDGFTQGGCTKLIFAAYEGRHRMLPALLRAGADHTLRDDDNKTALDWAKERKEQEAGAASTSSPLEWGLCVRILEAFAHDGAVLPSEDYFDKPRELLKAALERGDFDKMALLLELGAKHQKARTLPCMGHTDEDFSDHVFKTYMRRCWDENRDDGNEGMIRLFLEHSTTINRTWGLVKAFQRHHLGVVQLLLDFSESPALPGVAQRMCIADKATAAAIENGHIDFLQQLLTKGLDVQIGCAASEALATAMSKRDNSAAATLTVAFVKHGVQLPDSVAAALIAHGMVGLVRSLAGMGALTDGKVSSGKCAATGATKHAVNVGEACMDSSKDGTDTGTGTPKTVPGSIIFGKAADAAAAKAISDAGKGVTTSLEVLRILAVELKFQFDDSVAAAAVRAGNSELVETFINGNGATKLGVATMAAAIATQDCALAQQLSGVAQRMCIADKATAAAIENGHIDFLQQLLTKGLDVQIGCAASEALATAMSKRDNSAAATLTVAFVKHGVQLPDSVAAALIAHGMVGLVRSLAGMGALTDGKVSSGKCAATGATKHAVNVGEACMDSSKDGTDTGTGTPKTVPGSIIFGKAADAAAAKAISDAGKGVTTSLEVLRILAVELKFQFDDSVAAAAVRAGNSELVETFINGNSKAEDDRTETLAREDAAVTTVEAELAAVEAELATVQSKLAAAQEHRTTAVAEQDATLATIWAEATKLGDATMAAAIVTEDCALVQLLHRRKTHCGYSSRHAARRAMSLDGCASNIEMQRYLITIQHDLFKAAEVVRLGNIELVQLFLDGGSEDDTDTYTESKRAQGSTTEAITMGRLDILDLLLDRGVDFAPEDLLACAESKHTNNKDVARRVLARPTEAIVQPPSSCRVLSQWQSKSCRSCRQYNMATWGRTATCYSGYVANWGKCDHRSMHRSPGQCNACGCHDCDAECSQYWECAECLELGYKRYAGCKLVAAAEASLKVGDSEFVELFFEKANVADFISNALQSDGYNDPCDEERADVDAAGGFLSILCERCDDAIHAGDMQFACFLNNVVAYRDDLAQLILTNYSLDSRLAACCTAMAGVAEQEDFDRITELIELAESIEYLVEDWDDEDQPSLIQHAVDSEDMQLVQLLVVFGARIQLAALDDPPPWLVTVVDWEPLAVAVACRLCPLATAALRSGHINGDGILPSQVLAVASTDGHWVGSPPICQDTLVFAKMATGPWTPRKHFLYHPAFQAAINTVMHVAHRESQNSTRPQLPHEIWLHVCAFLKRADWN